MSDTDLLALLSYKKVTNGSKCGVYIFIVLFRILNNTDREVDVR